MSTDFDFGGGGGVPIGALVPIESSEALYTSRDQTVWIRSGMLETDTTAYPDAETSAGSIDSMISDESVSAQTTKPRGVSFDSVTKLFYVVGLNAASVHVYDENRAFVRNLTVDHTSSPISTYAQFVVHNGKFYIYSVTSIYRYNINAAPTNTITYEDTLATQFSTAISGTVNGAYDPGNDTFYHTRTASNRVTAYYANQSTGESGTAYQSNSVTSIQSRGIDIAFGRFYLLGWVGNRFYVYSTPYLGPPASALNLGTSDLDFDFDESPVSVGNPQGLAFNDTQMFTLSDSQDAFIRFDLRVGVGSRENQTLDNQGIINYYKRIA